MAIALKTEKRLHGEDDCGGEIEYVALLDFPGTLVRCKKCGKSKITSQLEG